MALLKWSAKKILWLKKNTLWLQKIASLTWQQWLLLGEAMVTMGIACIRLKLLPFKHIAATWGEPQCQDLHICEETFDSSAKQIGWAVGAVGNRLPWQGTCLIQAMAARQMLRRRSISNVLHFGVKKNKISLLDAHAWLSVGNHIVTGKRGHQQFSVLSIFVDRYET